MSKHLTPQEINAEWGQARRDTHDVHEQDGPRNAALFATIEATLERFKFAPHAPETTGPAVLDLADQARDAVRVADAYRITAADPLNALELLEFGAQPAAVVERAHGAVAQWAAAARQQATALESLQVELFEHLRGVLAHEN